MPVMWRIASNSFYKSASITLRPVTLFSCSSSPRRNRLRREKEKLAAQRSKLLELKRDQRLREVKVFDESRKSFLERQQRIHEAELNRLEEEARATRIQRQLEKENLEGELREGALHVSEGRGLEWSGCGVTGTFALPLDRQRLWVLFVTFSFWLFDLKCSYSSSPLLSLYPSLFSFFFP